jgi:F-type H+-transporting ATPase subunit epsilon
MNLKILLPFGVFLQRAQVLRIVAQTLEGSFGLLPQRLDFVASLAPSILSYETQAEGQVYVAVDEGLIVKCGPGVLVSVRRAISGTDLNRLRASVERDFLTLNEQEKNIRTVMARLESGFVRQFAEIHRG